jgi:ABC-type Fe3+ transport system substrate-binding protein
MHASMSRRSRLLPMAALAAALILPAAEAAAQSAKELPPVVAALLPLAKAEGATATAIAGEFDPAQLAAMSKGMSDFYGMSFSLQLPTAMHPMKAAEVVQGAKMGVESGLDLFWTGSAVGILLEKGGVVADFDWFKDLGIDESLRWGPKALRIHDPMLAGVAYNTEQIAPGELPHSYQDLAKNPKWKGRIAAPRAPNVFVYMSYGIGDEETRKLIKDLVEVQELKILPTYPDVSNRVLSGEFAIGLGVTATLQQRRGAPMEMAPIEPVILTPWAFWLMKDAKHPASAKLFGYWLTSPAGQKTLSDVVALSLYSTPDTDLARQIKGKKVIVVPHDFNIEALPRLGPAYSKLLGIR